MNFQTDDAQVWAQNFIKTLKDNPDIEIDESFMIGWFANAIETSSDVRRWKIEEERATEGL